MPSKEEEKPNLDEQINEIGRQNKMNSPSELKEKNAKLSSENPAAGKQPSPEPSSVGADPQTAPARPSPSAGFPDPEKSARAIASQPPPANDNYEPRSPANDNYKPRSPANDNDPPF
jgi:hypothetical protein